MVPDTNPDVAPGMPHCEADQDLADGRIGLPHNPVNEGGSPLGPEVLLGRARAVLSSNNVDHDESSYDWVSTVVIAVTLRFEPTPAQATMLYQHAVRKPPTWHPRKFGDNQRRMCGMKGIASNERRNMVRIEGVGHYRHGGGSVLVRIDPNYAWALTHPKVGVWAEFLPAGRNVLSR